MTKKIRHSLILIKRRKEEDNITPFSAVSLRFAEFKFKLTGVLVSSDSESV